MDKIKTIYTHRAFIPALCLMLAGLIIFLAGPYFSFAGYVPLASLISQIIFFTVIVSIYCVYLYIQHLKSQMKQDKLIDEMVKSDDISEAIDAESAALKDKFKSAFSALKNTKGGPTSLVELPWYMIIGSPGSGKTTLLSNSGLSFPLANKLDNKALQGIGGTKNCDWWITDEAVLLDTAGRYTSQDSFQKVDESGWYNFLGLIKRYRKKPISGLLVSFSMADLITMNEYQLSQHVYQLKQRVAEVNDFFKTRFPIYIVITKSDMLAGFTQFYDAFSHKEREQILGITFDQTDSLNAKISSVFGEKFAELLNAITRRQWSRMSAERDAQRKALIYSFSDQIASVKPALDTILNTLSEHDKNISSGIVRGVYFTSGTQSGTPIDRMLARVSEIFGFKRNAAPLWNNDQRSYFIKDLLQHVVFKEADEFGSQAGYERNKKRLKLASIVVFSALCFSFCVGLYLSFRHNSDYIKQANSSVDNWLEQHNEQNKQANVRQYLPALNDFFNNIEDLQSKQKSAFSSLGLSQENSVQQALKASYSRLLQSVLLPFIQQQIEIKLQDKSNPIAQYQALKSYLMLADPKRRDNQFLINNLLNSLKVESQFTQSEFSQLKRHIDNAIMSDVRIEAIDQALVASTRGDLSHQPLGEIHYKQLSDTYLSDPRFFISMDKLAGAQWRTVLSTQLNDVNTISRFYTPELFSKVTDKEIQQYVEKLADDAWILGPNNFIDKEAIAKQIEQLYVKDYIGKWQALLHSVSVKPIFDVASLSTSLEVLAAPDSPIFVLLESVSQSTKLVSLDIPLGKENNVAQNITKGFNEAQNRFNSEGPDFLITSRFKRLHSLMQNDKKLVTEQQMSNLLQQINVSLKFQLQNLQVASEPKSTESLQAFGFVQIAPLNRWVDELVSGIKVAQSRVKKTQLTNLWQSQILFQCKAIVDSKFPFQPSSETDASVSDLIQLFGPNGAVSQFFNTNLASLINMQTKPWRWKPQVQANYQFNDQVLPFFERVMNVQRTLFGANAQQPKLSFSMTPVYLDPKLSRFNMSIYGANLSYQFGRPTPTLVTWPPENPASRNQISYVRRDGSELIENQEGLFSLFKLIVKGKTTRLGPNKVQVTFAKNDFKAIYEIATASPTDPLMLSGLANFNCINSL